MSQNGNRTSESTLFVDHEDVRHCISVLTTDTRTTTTSERDNALIQLRAIFDKYLEFPSLLDVNLEEIISCLTTSARLQFHEKNSHTLSALYALSKVRGRKRIQRFFPHETRDVEPVFRALQNMILNPSSSFDTGPQSWESAYVLWLWLEMLSLVPFDCAVLSSDAFVPSLIQMAKTHLSLAGPVRETAASCLASWLNRPDLNAELDSFLEWSHDILVQFQQSTANNNVMLVIGVMETLTRLLKCNTTNQMHFKMEPLWKTALNIAETNSTMILRKLFTKWFARMGCAYMPPRIASWRYKRGRRSLLDNISQPSETQNEESGQEAAANELFNVPDQVEDAMGIVLESLTDPSTVVRWSAAKGVGRMTERLPAICADDVLDYILELCRDPEKDNAWQGACLALAELARRGLLLPARLVDVVPLVVKAIQFDVRRGQSSVGSHVRDAACYSYWAFARAYAPSILKPFVPELSRSIVLAFLFDREVNCRRAASAAFQECVGRQGANNFIHGISILTTADYFSLGNIKNAYTNVALHVAQFPEYRCHIINHLYRVKLSHWDIEIRTLASKSLHGVTPLDPELFKSLAIPYLVEHSLNENLHVRHGAVTGLAEVMLALGETESCSFENLHEDTLDSVVELVAEIEKMRLYRGRGGEIMRTAVCRLIECISQARVPLTVKQQIRYLDSIDACLKHPNEDIQEAASKALFFLMRSYFPVRENGPSDRLQHRVVNKYVDIVSTSVNPAETRGFSLALGSLPNKLLAPSLPVLSSVIGCLCKVARYDSRVGNEADAETRRNALLSLSRVCETVGLGPSGSNSREPNAFPFPTVAFTADMVSKVYESFLLALEDYNVDRRGDVGSWSRVAAMRGLECLMYAISQFMPSEQIENGTETGNIPFLDESLCIRVIGGLLKQLSEKLDSVRSHAGGCLSRMLTCTSPSVSLVPRKDRLIECLELDPTTDGSQKITNWANPVITYRLVMACADIDEFFPYVLSGMIISVGGLGESVSRYSEEALLAWIRERPAVCTRAAERSERVANELVGLFRRNQRKRRVILPLLKTLDKLLNSGCFNGLVHSTDSIFCISLVSCMIMEAKGCNDVHTLLAIVEITLGLLSSQHCQQLSNDIMVFICQMLCHEFPRVRRFTADNLYVRLLEEPDLLRTQVHSEPALELLLEAPWDSDMNRIEANDLSSKFAKMSGINAKSRGAIDSDVHETKRERAVDEFASYASLVNSRS